MVPPFVQKLYELVNAPSSNELIRWSDAGDSFFVFEHERFANDILPRFFKHRNFASFVRQLNMYGFHKIPHLQQGVLKSDTDTEFWNFEHPNFHRGQPDLLCLVTRKNSKGGSQQNPDLADGDAPISSQTTGGNGTQILDVNSIVNGITAIKRHQQAISADLNDLKTSNQHLWKEALAARERYKSQQDTIDRILKFLASVFGRATGHDGKDVDAHSASTPLVRRNPRLLIDNGFENNKHKGVEVVEVEDDDNKSTAETVPLEDQPETPHPFSQIDASSIKSPSVPPASPLFEPPTTSGTYPSDRASAALMAPTWANTQSNSNISMPTPVFASTKHNSALELHRPQSTHVPPQSPTHDQIMQAAFQQLMQSPGQVQRLVQLLSTNPSNPFPTSLTGPVQSSSWSPPSSVDIPQLSQLALYDSNVGGGNNALTFDSKDIVTPTTSSQLAEAEARLAHTYQNANEINADVNVLQASIDALLENMGVESAALANTDASAASAHPLAHTPSGETPPVPTITDFDFDAFLTAFANEQDGANAIADVNVASDGIAGSASGPSSPEVGKDAITALPEEQPTIAGQKRTSDVAGLELPPSRRSKTPPSRALAMGGDATTSSSPSPRVKRNKK